MVGVYKEHDGMFVVVEGTSLYYRIVSLKVEYDVKEDVCESACKRKPLEINHCMHADLDRVRYWVKVLWCRYIYYYNIGS